MRVALVVLAVVAGCLPPKTIRVANHRGVVWAQPETSLVFVESYREREKKQRVYEMAPSAHSEESGHWDTDYYSKYDHVRFTALDPQTGATIQLVEHKGGNGGTPIYWDRRGQILWVAGSDNEVTGYSPSRTIETGMTVGTMPLPFIANRRKGTILDMWSGQTIDVGPDDGGEVTIDGDILRITRMLEDLGQMVVEQIIVDWKDGVPHRLAGVSYRTPLLPEGAVRTASDISADGRWFVEVVNSNGAASFVVHDLDMRTINALPVPVISGKGVIQSLGGDRFVYGVYEARDLGERSVSCLSGASIVVNAGIVSPLPSGVCITSVEGVRGRSWIETRSGTGYIDGKGTLLQLGTTLNKPLVIGPTQIAYAVPAAGGVDVLTFDFATSTRATVAHHASEEDTLLSVGSGGAVFLSGDRVITVTKSGPPRVFALPSADALQAAKTTSTPLASLEASRDVDAHVVGHADALTVVVSLASWCEVCKHELGEIDRIRATHPHVRWLGLDYKGHEEYDGRGSSSAIRELAHATPWLRIVPADDALFSAFGDPPKVPTVFVFDRSGALVTTFDRRTRAVPEAAELDALLRRLE